jgi:hypothetical protein
MDKVTPEDEVSERLRQGGIVRVQVEGRWAYATRLDHPPGWTKIIFDDGDCWISRPVTG